VLSPDQLQDFAATLAADGEPGLAVGVYTGGQLVSSATAGCAVIEHAVPVTEHTAFDIASVSKHLTSACLLLLARDGLADLDADLRSVLPELRLTRPVTLRQCLTHTAGLRDYFALCDIAGLPVLGITQDRFADLVAGQADLDFPAGSAFSYSNTGYALAAIVVRRVTGSGLARFASERLFAPLGMTATHFREDVSLLVPRLAAGYVAAPASHAGQQGPAFRRCDVTEEVVGDGAIVTTLADLAAWHSFMATGAVLGADIRDGLLARQVLTDGTQIGYALGLESIDVGGNSAWWHSGSWAGYRAAVIYLPGQRAGVSVLANRNDRYASYVALAVAGALVAGDDPAAHYQALAGLPAAAEQAESAARGLAGLWHEPDQDVFAEFEADAGQLVLREHGDEQRFALATDGSWHGTGPAAGGTYTAADGTLLAGWGLSARPQGRYLRAGPAAGGPSPLPVPAGIFRNEELRAYAELKAGESGALTVVIGLAAPRRLGPAGDGVWRSAGRADADDACAAGDPEGGPLTVRLTEDAAALLVSVPGAHHVRFDRVPGAAADRGVLRGLRGAR
jgi:CubicO group peptidase (beta-lactamase class C family)